MNTPVSFELAKLLKEKKFDESTHSFFVIDESGGYGDIEEFITDPEDIYPSLYSNSNFDTLASAPTIAEVVMWLYEKYKIWISVDAGILGFYGYYKVNPLGTLSSNLKQGWSNTEENPLKTPTEAYEAAIKYTLENIIK